MHFAARTSLLMTLLALSFGECTLLGAATVLTRTKNQKQLSHPLLAHWIERPELQNIVIEYLIPETLDYSYSLRRTPLKNYYPGESLITYDTVHGGHLVADTIGERPRAKITLPYLSSTFFEASLLRTTLTRYTTVISHYQWIAAVGRQTVLKKFRFIYLWNFPEGKCLHKLPIPISLDATTPLSDLDGSLLALSPDGNWVTFYHYMSKTLFRWDLRTNCSWPTWVQLSHENSTHSREKTGFLDIVSGDNILPDGSIFYRAVDLNNNLHTYIWYPDASVAQHQGVHTPELLAGLNAINDIDTRSSQRLNTQEAQKTLMENIMQPPEDTPNNPESTLQSFIQYRKQRIEQRSSDCQIVIISSSSHSTYIRQLSSSLTH